MGGVGGAKCLVEARVSYMIGPAICYGHLPYPKGAAMDEGESGELAAGSKKTLRRGEGLYLRVGL